MKRLKRAFSFTLNLIEIREIWSMIGPQKVRKALIAMDASYFLQKLPGSKHEPVNKSLAKLNHHTSLSLCQDLLGDAVFLSG